MVRACPQHGTLTFYGPYLVIPFYSTTLYVRGLLTIVLSPVLAYGHLLYKNGEGVWDILPLYPSSRNVLYKFYF